MNSDDAVRSFALAGNLQIGGSLSTAIGPIGTGGAIQAAIAHPAPMFSYSRSKGERGMTGGGCGIAGRESAVLTDVHVHFHTPFSGLFAGISLEGTILVERKDANREFYGQPIPAVDLLSGKVPAPEAASALYEVVEAAEAIDETGVPQQAYVPASSTQGAYDLGSGSGGNAPPSTAAAATTSGASTVPATEGATDSTTAGGSKSGGSGGDKTVFDADQH